jgi:hypothetical protein
MSSFIFAFSGRLDSSIRTSRESEVGCEYGAPPTGLEAAHHTLFTPNAVQFVAELVENFDKQVNEVMSS